MIWNNAHKNQGKRKELVVIQLSQTVKGGQYQDESQASRPAAVSAIAGRINSSGRHLTVIKAKSCPLVFRTALGHLFCTVNSAGGAEAFAPSCLRFLIRKNQVWSTSTKGNPLSLTANFSELPFPLGLGRDRNPKERRAKVDQIAISTMIRKD